tara:strand:- start:229 stop:354 length:126 start_codon:yes stop_codon:yes gene_type:complete
MKILELFAGSRSFSKVAEDLGYERSKVPNNLCKEIFSVSIN